MSLSRAAIVDQLKEIVGADRVITDETVLKKNSIDRFRKFPDIHGIYTLPIPAAVVKLGSTEQVSRVLNFMNAHKINGVPRTGASATEGGLETVVENSVVLDGSAMNQIINIDIENMQATAQCGVPLEVLENALREKGYTTGHSPQSKPLAQMGGLVATRSIGHSPHSTAQSKIWSLVWKQYWLMAPSHALKTCHAARLARTFATSSSVTKVHFAISLK
ncbi:putative FAD-binding oxidoreductase [Escherichia coli]|uniref:Putative FAD-binding oxidoreductase n=1 Tax=Escherichia coli TaxID=562 RepID=A0A376UFL5_ECOLX|nr:putative FAD-binding oxidoreductase [Escherichia coli]